ncbi:desulfoferrodoxin [Candidatus Woesearchaeota archaeon]|nr:desulfoferrodoxin [Candidatus Woesearchaeota archaeon]
MAEQNGIYKCEICGNVVSVIEANKGELVCCGQPMKLLEEKTAKQEGKEKHVPVVEIYEDKVAVKIGSVPHPMEENHFIELIQILKDEKVIAEKRLFPGDEPKAEFCLKDAEGIKARELCNVHGLWIN